MATFITRDELKKKVENRDDFKLVEALPEEAFHESHLPGAINIPFAEMKDRSRTELPDKEAEVVVYCASESCDAAAKTVAELEKMGYSNVWHYEGGKKDWMDAGFPVKTAEPHAV